MAADNVSLRLFCSPDAVSDLWDVVELYNFMWSPTDNKETVSAEPLSSTPATNSSPTTEAYDLFQDESLLNAPIDFCAHPLGSFECFNAEAQVRGQTFLQSLRERRTIAKEDPENPEEMSMRSSHQCSDFTLSRCECCLFLFGNREPLKAGQGHETLSPLQGKQNDGLPTRRMPPAKSDRVAYFLTLEAEKERQGREEARLRCLRFPELQSKEILARGFAPAAIMLLSDLFCHANGSDPSPSPQCERQATPTCGGEITRVLFFSTPSFLKDEMKCVFFSQISTIVKKEHTRMPALRFFIQQNSSEPPYKEVFALLHGGHFCVSLFSLYQMRPLWTQFTDAYNSRTSAATSFTALQCPVSILAYPVLLRLQFPYDFLTRTLLTPFVKQGGITVEEALKGLREKLEAADLSVLGASRMIPAFLNGKELFGCRVI